jgi:hypothetical protein
MSIFNGRAFKSVSSRRNTKSKTPFGRLAAAVDSARPSRSLVRASFEALEGRTLFAAPTLTNIQTFGSAAGVTGVNDATEDTAYVITYAQLKAMSDVADADGDTIKFRIEAVSTGTLKKGTAAVVAGTTLVGAGDTLTWTPAANANGNLTAFTVKASDGTNLSSTAVAVHVTTDPVNDPPSITSVNTLTGGTEDTAYTIDFATLAAAVQGGTDVDGDSVVYQLAAMSSGKLTKNGVTVTPSDPLRSVLNPGDVWVWTPAANAFGTLNAFTIKTMDPSGLTSSTAAQVKITVASVNDAPTLTNVNTLTGASEDTPFTITYASLAAASNMTDVDGTTDTFRIQAVSGGTLTKGGTAITAGTTTLGVGESLVWTPASNVNGLLPAFTVEAYDGTLASSTPIQVNINVAAVDDAPTLTSVDTFLGGTEDSSYDISYEALVANTDVADIDSTNVWFKVAAISSGTLSLDDGVNSGINVVAGTTLIKPGYILTWTPAANANGTGASALTAFTIKANDGTLDSSTSIPVKVSVAPVPDAPTLTTITTLTGASEDTGYSITFANFATAANDADADGDHVSFRIESLTSGTLTKGGSAVVPGTTTFDTGDTLVWTPDPNANGTLNAFTVRAVDDSPSNLYSATPVQVKVAVTAVNDAPTLSSISTLTAGTEDTPYTVTYAQLLAASDAGDVDGGTTLFRIEAVSTGTLKKGTTAVTAGTTTLGVGETLTWTPAADANGILNAFTVKAYDGTLASATAIQVKVGVAAVNDAPVMTSIANLTGGIEDTPFSLTYSALSTAAGATDVDSSTINFQITSLGSGTLTENGLPVTVGKVITSADTLIWTPVANANGTATNALSPFSVKATDGALLSATAIAVKVNVANVNDAPTLSTISTLSGATEDTAFTITYATLSAASNANDIEGPVLFRIEAISGGTLTKGGVAVTAGTTTLGTGESFVWTPAANANGTGANAVNAFTVKAYDGQLASPTAIQVKVNVNPVNDAPTLSTVTPLTGATEDTPYTITYAALAAASNLVDVDGTSDSFLISAVTSGTLTKNGAAVVAGTTLVGVGDSLVWTPAANVNGTGVAAFTVKATDGTLTTSTAIPVKVNITAVNDAPTLTSFTNLAGASEDTAFNITYAALKTASNAADVEGDTISFRIETVASGTLTKGGVAVTAGTTTVAVGDTLVWTPAANAYGTGLAGLPVMTVSAFDGAAYSTGPVLVRADVANVNDAPTLSTISTFTSADAATENTPYPMTYAALLAASNAADIDGPVIMFRVEAVSSGTLTKSGVPVVAGTTTIAPGETLIWTPALNANGTATQAFTVKAYDGALASSTAVPVLIDITAVNQAPTFTSVATLTGATEDTAYNITYAAFASASNASDPESDTLTYTIGTVSSGTLTKSGSAVVPGTTTFAAGDTLVWTPASNANGVLNAFTVSVDDGNSHTVGPIQVKVNAAAVNDGPPADSGSVTALTGGTEDTPLTITYAQIMTATGMTDPDPEQTIQFRIASIVSGTLTKNGTAVTTGVSGTLISVGDSVVWTPDANANGSATHAFTIYGYDGIANSVATSAIDVDVAAVNDAPTLTSTTTLITNANSDVPTEDTAFSIAFADLATNAADVDGDTISYRIESVVNGTLTKSGTAVTPGTTLFAAGDTLVWTPSANVNGTIPAFTISATDGTLFSSTPVTVNVAVTAVPDNPVLTTVNTFTKGIENTPLTISYADLLANSDLSDADGGAVLFKIMTVDTGTLTKAGVAVTAGTTTLAAGETLTWTPDANANGSGIHAFTVKGWDGALASTTAAVQVSVNIAHVAQMPTMTSVTNITTNANSDVPTEDTAFSIAFADLTTDAIDPEGGAISYRIESIPAGGTLTKSGVAVVPGVTLFSAGDTLVWTPPANANGLAMTAFTIRAVTTAGVSSTKLPVTVDVTAVNDAPTLTEVMPFNGAGEDLAFPISYAQLLVNSDLKDVDTGDTLQFKIMVVSTGTLTKNGSAVVAGTTLVGAGDILSWTPAANANGALNAFTVKGWDGTVLSSTAVQVKVNVSAINNAPTFTSVTTLTGASAGVAYSVTYAALSAAGDQTDVDSSTINFVVGSVLSGTLTKNGVAVIAGVTSIKTGDTLVWTSVANATGDTPAFTLFATDGQDLSSTAVSVLITVA